MKVLSIDIGLRNLSFNIMAKDGDKYRIHLWENYNLLDDPVVKCSSLTKKGKGSVCGKNCKFTAEGIYFCKIHLPKMSGSKEKVKVKVKEIIKKKVDSYTLQEISLIVLKKVVQIFKDNPDGFSNLDMILIEKQLRLNPKMIMVSNLVFGKLTELLEGEKTTIRFVNASRKGLLFCDSEIKGTLKGNKGYANRKKASIEFGTKFLQSGQVIDSQKWIEKLATFGPKLDDAYDSICYSISELIPKKIKKRNLHPSRII